MDRATLATPGGTSAFAAGADLVESAYAPLGRTGLVVSRLGFGAYRVDDRVPAQSDALASALLQGVNLVDTSSNYTDGHSETLVGQVVGQVIAAGKATRDGLVVVSKAGYAQGENLARAKEREAKGAPFADMVKLAPELWHSIAPEWLEDQLTRSLERLGLAALDVLLLHNPEYFLNDAKKRGVPLAEARAAFDDRIRRAFERLEEEADRGRIGWYGVSSNTFGAADDEAEATSVTRMLAIARDVARARGKDPDDHRFAVIELPLNLLEPAVATVRKEGPDGKQTVLEFAREHGLGVLANRPLNAFVQDRLVRLAEPAELRAPIAFADALEEVRAIEAIFREDFAPRIQVEGQGPRPEQLFRWGEGLAHAPDQVTGLEHWAALQGQVIGPQTNAALSALARAFGGNPAFQAWASRYVDALDALIGSISAELVARARRRAEELRRRLEPSVPPPWRQVSLSRQAIAAVLGVEGVTAALVGMRRKEYVEDALGAVALPRPGKLLVGTV
jgi:aryl-alcohol dehydrogenase-like predicted oxidoreductase